jgi:hypothetical protein
MSLSTDDRLKREYRARQLWALCLPRGPSKDELRRMIADAVANTLASADSGTAVRLARQERRA